MEVRWRGDGGEVEVRWRGGGGEVRVNAYWNRYGAPGGFNPKQTSLKRDLSGYHS